VAGGYLTEHFGWQAIFLVNVPIGILAVALTMRLPVMSTVRVEWRSDPGGLILFTIFVATTLLALQQAQRANLDAVPLGVALFVVAVIALILLVRYENKAPSPLIPLNLLRQPAIWHSDALAGCHGAALVSLITFLPVYLQIVRGESPSTTGLLLVPLTLGIGAGSLLTGRLVSKSGRTTIFPAVGLVLATMCLVVLALWASAFSRTALSGLLLVIGLLMGTVMGVVQVTVQSAAGSMRLGEAAASVQFSRSIGAAFGTALVATVLFAFLDIRNPEAARSFALMVEHANITPKVPPIQAADIIADIQTAFRLAFLLIATFTTAGFLLAVTNPMRRI
jgi:predicted MFS family arabinose efflux permease